MLRPLKGATTSSGRCVRYCMSRYDTTYVVVPVESCRLEACLGQQNIAFVCSQLFLVKFNFQQFLLVIFSSFWTTGRKGRVRNPHNTLTRVPPCSCVVESQMLILADWWALCLVFSFIAHALVRRQPIGTLWGTLGPLHPCFPGRLGPWRCARLWAGLRMQPYLDCLVGLLRHRDDSLLICLYLTTYCCLSCASAVSSPCKL
jgi:hypothetical protein